MGMLFFQDDRAPPLTAIFLGGHLQRFRGDFLPAGTNLATPLRTPEGIQAGYLARAHPHRKNTQFGVLGMFSAVCSWGIEVGSLLFKLFKSYIVQFSAQSATQKMEYCVAVCVCDSNQL